MTESNPAYSTKTEFYPASQPYRNDAQGQMRRTLNTFWSVLRIRTAFTLPHCEKNFSNWTWSSGVSSGNPFYKPSESYISSIQ